MQIEKGLVESRRNAKKNGDFFLEPEGKVAIVVHIRGIIGVSPKVKKILQLLRLRQIHNAVFVKLNKATLQMLNLVGPYIAWQLLFFPILFNIGYYIQHNLSLLFFSLLKINNKQNNFLIYILNTGVILH